MVETVREIKIFCGYTIGKKHKKTITVNMTMLLHLKEDAHSFFMVFSIICAICTPCSFEVKITGLPPRILPILLSSVPAKVKKQVFHSFVSP